MSNQKMLNVMNEVNSEVAEREELVECIAVALLSKKNLFILGETGQAKSHCINEFRKRITDAKQFERLLSKQTDEDQLFGRIDLASLIPGNIPEDELKKDVSYCVLYNKLRELCTEYEITGDGNTRESALKLTNEMEQQKKLLYALNGNRPKMVTDGKIPDSHIVFLDEIFKSNDGILNSLLTALNERVYTNEGQTVQIPVISFFSASNEIPDFKDPEQQILKPLYDRFDLKVVTRYVEDRQNRLKVLTNKQKRAACQTSATITLRELAEMQAEVSNITIPVMINELMDDILCALRGAGIHVSDRKFFNYSPLAQAKAFLRGSKEVSPNDLIILKNYLWTDPKEIPGIETILTNMCQNPVHSKLVDLLDTANECFESFKENSDNPKAFALIRKQLIEIYNSVCDLQPVTNNDAAEISRVQGELEKISKGVYEIKEYTVVPLAEAREQQVA